MLENLHLASFYFLSDIGLHGMTTLLAQLWITIDSIGFTNPQEIDVWNGYIHILKSSHVRISSDDDALV